MAVISGFNTIGAPADLNLASQDQVYATEDTEESIPPSTKEKVHQYFKDLPIMIDVARCESHYRQTNKDGSIFRGEKNRYDVGVMQINELYHLKESKKLGYDIYTLEGNLAYARYLYEKEGARPWMASSPCWAKYSNIAKS